MAFAPTDQELLAAAAQGDEAAFGQLYLRYRNRVYGFAQHMLGAPALAEDVTHEAFLVLIQHPQRYQAARASLLTFLCAVARHHILQHLRRQGRCAPEPDETAELWNVDPLDELLAHEMSERVTAALAALPLAQREVLVLREYQELSYAEIATVSETDVNVVKARLYRARQALAKRLASYVAVGVAEGVKR